MSLGELLKNWFFARSLKTRIFIFVLSVHMLAISYFQISYAFTSLNRMEPVKKQVTVKTVKLSPPQVKTTSSGLVEKTDKEIAASPAKEKIKTSKEVKESKVVDKKITNSKTSTKKTNEKTKETKPSSTSSKPLYASTEIQKALKSLESIQAPVLATSLNESPEGVDFESLDETEQLGLFLRSWLKLPEFGKVTVKVRVTPQGKILNIEVLNSESKRNQVYIEQNLCLLTLPVAKNDKARQSERTLVLVLSNE